MKKLPKQTIVPVTQECYLEMVAALELAGAASAVGKAGAQLGRFLFLPALGAPPEQQPDVIPLSDVLARHRAKVIG